MLSFLLLSLRAFLPFLKGNAVRHLSSPPAQLSGRNCHKKEPRNAGIKISGFLGGELLNSIVISIEKSFPWHSACFFTHISVPSIMGRIYSKSIKVTSIWYVSSPINSEDLQVFFMHQNLRCRKLQERFQFTRKKQVVIWHGFYPFSHRQPHQLQAITIGEALEKKIFKTKRSNWDRMRL